MTFRTRRRVGQSRRDPHIERRLRWLRAETARLGGRWPVKIGLELAAANYQTYCDRGHGDWRHEAWRLVQISAELLSEIETN